MKKITLFFISLMSVACMLILADSAGAVDGQILTAFSANSVSVDTSISNQAVTAIFTVSDSGNISLNDSLCKLTSDSSDQIQYGVITNQNSGNYACEITLPKGSANGNWYFSLVLSDTVGNSTFYNSDDIKAAIPDASGTIIENMATVVDQAGPVLTAFSADPVLINTDTQAKTITATFSIVEPSGLNPYSLCDLFSNGIDQVQYGEIRNISGNNYTCDITIPSGLAGGHWYFQLQLVDNFGNYSYYNAAVNNNEIITAVPSAVGSIITDESNTIDEIGPALIAFSADPTVVDTGFGNQEVTATFTTTDPNGVDFDFSGCFIYSPDTNQAVYGDVTHLTDDNYSCIVTLPVYAESSDWYFGVSLQDYRGNISSYKVAENDNEILVAVPSAIGTIITTTRTKTDEDAPVLTGFSANPTSINTSVEEQTVVAEFSVLDSSGLDSENSLCAVFGDNDHTLLEGKVSFIEEEKYRCEITFPIGSVSGQWYYYLYLSDKFGNWSFYDAEINGDEIKSAVNDATGTVIMVLLPDQVSPTTSFSSSGTKGANDWYTSDVQVTLSATDNENGSGVDKTEYFLNGGEAWVPYTDPFTISNEGTHEIKYHSIDLAGNVEADQNATIKIDKTAPVITGAATPAANEKGWNKSDVNVDFVCEDTGANQSGVDINTIAGNTLTNDGAGQSLTNAGKCIDVAGNIAASVIVSGINIDKTAPEITLETPAGGEKYVLHSTVTAKWSAKDLLSGIDSFEGTVESGNQIDTSSVGPKDFSVTATDLAGNSVTEKVRYDVVYLFGGFQSPTTRDKSFNRNSSIPVKFQLTDASGKYISGAVASLKIDDIEAVSSGNSSDGAEFRYSVKDNQYIFNLALKSMSLESGVHTLKIGLDDGTNYEQVVTLK